MENENVAAPTGEAAPLSTTNSETTPPSAPAPEAPAPIFSHEEAQAIKTFLDNNGGLEGVKKTISARQAMQQSQPQAQITAPSPLNDVATQQSQVMAQPQQPAQTFKGGISTEEFMTQQYFESLSKREEYATVADQIRSGEVLKEMAKFNIQPMIDGRINSEGIKTFMDLYAKTVPPAPAETPVTATPTVDYIQVGETITNMDQAMAVLAQDREARSKGLAGHPMAEQANKFFDEALNAQANRGKVNHKTIDELRKAQ